MPLYEYACDACGQRFELIRKFSESELDACTLCGKGPVRRLMSSPAIQFKGTGWYVTDYASKGKSSTEAATPSKSETKNETKKTESGSSGSTDSAPSKSDSAGSSNAPKSSSET
jgi:putative FmdB family regulatory protein